MILCWSLQERSWSPLPVLGNGDVKSAHDVLALMQQSACDGVMIGRACMGDPFIFARANALLNNEVFVEPPEEEIRQMLHQQAELALQLEGSRMAIHLVRQFIMWRVRGRPGVNALRSQAGQSKNLAELLCLADKFFYGSEELCESS